MPAPADPKAQVIADAGPAAAPATSMLWQQQQQQHYQGQQRVFGVLDMVPDMQAFETELSMLRQRAHQLTADRLHLQPQTAPLLAPAAPSADIADGSFSLFGVDPLLAETDTAERLPKRQWLSSSGLLAQPPKDLPLPVAASAVEAVEFDSSSDSPANTQLSVTPRPAAKKPRHAGPAAAAAAAEEEEDEADDASTPLMASMAAATQLFLQQILAEIDADQDPEPRAGPSAGPQNPQLAAPGPHIPQAGPLVPEAEAAPGPLVLEPAAPGPLAPVPVAAAAGPQNPPQAGNNNGHNAAWPFRELKFRVDNARKLLVRLQRQQDLDGQRLAEAVAQRAPLQQCAQLKRAFDHSEGLKKRTCALHESLKRRFKVASAAWYRQRQQQQQQ